MKNANAVAAWVSGHAVIAAQVVARRYFHAKLGTYWQTEITADAAAAVLWVGREGIRGAAVRVIQAVKRVWSAPKPVPPAA